MIKDNVTSFLKDGKMLVFLIYFIKEETYKQLLMICVNAKAATTLDMIYKGVRSRQQCYAVSETIISVHQINKFWVSSGFIHTLKTITFFHNFNKNSVSYEIKQPQ